MKSFINKVKKHIEKFKLFKKGERVLACVSAGVDSVSLLKFLKLIEKEYKLSIFVSHYDHKIRKESLEDAIFVYNLCKEWKIPFFYSTAPVPLYARREKLSLEMAGRELRYRLWYRLAREHNFQKIVLAHHLDDLAEEIFMRLIRGTGRRGLTGIPIKRDNLIVRPFLCVSKEEIKAFALEHNLKWREDVTNQDLRFLRNKIRHILIPFIEKHFGRNIKTNLKETALIIAEEEELIEELALSKFKKIKSKIEDSLSLKIHELKTLPGSLRKRIYFLAAKEAGVPLFRITHRHINQIETLIAGKGKGPIYLPGNYLIYKTHDHLLFTQKTFKTSYWEIIVKKEGEYLLPDKNFVFLIKKCKKDSIKPDEGEMLSAKKIALPLIIRKRKEGDKVFIKGLGHKKLKKLFQEKKIPFYLREAVPVVEYRNEIVAIPEVYLNTKFLPEEDEEEVWVIEFKKA